MTQIETSPRYDGQEFHQASVEQQDKLLVTNTKVKAGYNEFWIIYKESGEGIEQLRKNVEVLKLVKVI